MAWIGPLPIRAEETLLSGAEVTELSIQAFAQDKKALNRLIGEFRRYQRMVHEDLPLSESEKNLLKEIMETLELLSPQSLPAKGLLMPKPITVRKPERKQTLSAELVARSTTYFDFQQGQTLIYSGQRRNFLDGQWSENEKTLKIHVLTVDKAKGAWTEIVTLAETILDKNQWLAEQSLIRYRISSEGVQRQRKVVFSQPYPGTLAPVGEQEPHWIVRFPLREESLVEGYKVNRTSTSFKTPMKEFQGCLALVGYVDKMTFARQLGLIFWEIFDERWYLKEIRTSPYHELEPLGRRDWKNLFKAVKRSTRKRQLSFESICSLSVLEKEPQLTVQVRTLTYETDKLDPQQRRFILLEERWVKRVEGGKVVWVLLPLPYEGGEKQ
jgi:hypothetical protein